MDSMQLGVLDACQELVIRQQELLGILAEKLQVPPAEVLYWWVFHKSHAHGQLEGTDWTYFFHGAECDLRNVSDKRFVRIDFGPHGRTDTFIMWGVLQFIMTSVAPWTEFPELRVFLAKEPPPYDHLSGSVDRMEQMWDRLQAKGVFAKADQDLLDFQARYTSVGSDGITYVRDLRQKLLIERWLIARWHPGFAFPRSAMNSFRDAW